MDKDFSKTVADISQTIDFAKTKYSLTLDSSMGKINLKFFPDIAPNHCKNMIALAKAGFYDNLLFHRVVKNFVIQGGCPSGTGTGGPGYKVDAEFNDRPHVAGTLSMARANHPNSAGSQFFLCLGDADFLNNQYTVFGETADEESLKVVLAIGKVKTGFQDRPSEEVKINKATVTEENL